MRKVRTTILLAAVASLVVAFAVPALAQASNWKKNGVEMHRYLRWMEGSSPVSPGKVVTLTGQLQVKNVVNCPFESATILSTKKLVNDTEGEGGHVVTFNVAGELGNCEVIGEMAELGCEEVTSIVTTSPQNGKYWPLKLVHSSSTSKSWVEIENFGIEYEFIGGRFCTFGIPITVEAKGNLIATPDKESAVSSLSLSGTVETPLGPEGVTGSLGVTPAGKYGIGEEAFPTSIEGTINVPGGASCPVEGTLALEPGNTGTVTWTGEEAVFCQATEIEFLWDCQPEMKIGGSAVAHDEGSSIGLSGVEFEVNWGGMGEFCSRGTTFGVSENLTLTPENINSIQNMSLSGSGGVNGSMYMTPGKTYGL